MITFVPPKEQRPTLRSRFMGLYQRTKPTLPDRPLEPDRSADTHHAGFDIALDRMKYHEPIHQGASVMLFDGAALRYDAKAHRDITEEHLFFGPYVALSAGAYKVRVDGMLSGRLLLQFSKNGGMVIKEVTVNSFDEAIHFNLAEDIEDFEIVFVRTKWLEALEIRRITMEVYEPAANVALTVA